MHYAFIDTGGSTGIVIFAILSCLTLIALGKRLSVTRESSD